MKPESVKQLKSAAVFLLKLNLLAVPLYVVTVFNWHFQPLQDLWALALGQSLHSLGYQTAVEGNVIAVEFGRHLYQLTLSWDSTGWKSLYALAALVFASAGPLSGKTRFLAFGLPLVALVNLVRIVSTAAFSVQTDFAYFELVHGLLWSGLMVAFVVCAWYFLFFQRKS